MNRWQVYVVYDERRYKLGTWLPYAHGLRNEVVADSERVENMPP
jgi:hypothetical protein